MTEKELRAWNSRPMTVTVLDRCDECETLKPDVRERWNYTRTVRMTCCGDCDPAKGTKWAG